MAEELILQIHPLPYMLYPDIPDEGVAKHALKRSNKPGMGRALRQEVKAEGIALRYDRIERIPSSLLAHLLVNVVQDNVLASQLTLEIFRAYFNDGLDIGSHVVLKELTASLKIDSIAIDILSLAEEREAFRTKILKRTRSQGIGVVPHIVINEQVNLPGLQSEEIWTSYFRRAAQKFSRDRK